MATKRFSERLAALEALEAAQEAERTGGGALPDVATLDDGEVLWEATLALRGYALYTSLYSPCGSVDLHVGGLIKPAYGQWYRRLAARAQPLLDASPKPLVLLAPWEVEDAIELIDAGQVTVAVEHGVYSSLRPGPLADADAKETLGAVNWAADLLQRQLYYPQPRNFREPELITLAEWRAWLVALEQSDTGGFHGNEDTCNAR